MSDELDNQGTQIVAEQANFQQEQPQPEQKAEEPKREDTKEQNMRALRQQAEDERRARLDTERKLQELEQFVRGQQPQQQQPVEEEVDFDIKDEDFVEGKHVKKPMRKFQKELKETRKKLEEQSQYFASVTAETRLKSQFNDFDTIVTKENLERLAQTKPSLYRTMMSNPDLYDKGYTAYEMIRGSGINTTEYETEDNRINSNKTKPRSVSAAAPQAQEAPLARAADYDRRVLTEERKEQLRRQVEEAKRNR
jgi:hypothetical protein